LEQEAFPGLNVHPRWCQPANLGTVDCSYICRCDDGSDYAVKDGSQTPTLPHQEWFCTRLGEDVGVASPTIRVVQMNGVECFGSRWESGAETGTPKDRSTWWWPRAHRGEIEFAPLAPAISRIFAFDLFIHNVDRHLTNYLVLKQHTGYAIRSFDYSRAWLFNGFPLPPLPMNATAKTVAAIRALRQLFGDFIKINEVSHVCDKLRSTSLARVQSFIDEHPPSWLTKDQKLSILDWWPSEDRMTRIDQVEEGINSGTCL